MNPVIRTVPTLTGNPTGAAPKVRGPRRTTARALAAAAGLSLMAAVAGCEAMESSSAITYEVEVLSGADDGETVRVEYTTRQTGLSEPETTGATIPAGGTEPETFETIGRAEDEVTISVQGVPGVTLRCAVVQDGSVVLVEQESTEAGQPVTCTATVQD